MIFSITDVVPFYIAWIICGFLMIDRNTGRSAMIIFTMIVAYFEYQARVSFGQEAYK